MYYQINRYFFLYFAVRASLITPFQLSPYAKSYTLPSLSLYGFISCGTSSFCVSTVCISAGICKGNKPDGSVAPERISINAWSCTPNVATKPSTCDSNSATTAGFDKAMHTITGLLFIAAFVSNIDLRSVMLLAVTVLPL